MSVRREFSIISAALFFGLLGINPVLAAATYDGDWQGSMKCSGTSGGASGFTTTVTMTITGAKISAWGIGRQTSGKIQLDDTLFSDPGDITIRGDYDGRRKQYSFSGEYGETIKLKGRRGPRRCTIALTKVEITLTKVPPDQKRLRRAISHGDLAVVKSLVESGIDVNQPSPAGRLPLVQAALLGQKEIVVALIAAGADLKSAWAALPATEKAGNREAVVVIREALRRPETTKEAKEAEARLAAQADEQRKLEAKRQAEIENGKAAERLLDTESKKMIQQALKDLGFLKGAVDGVFGPGTRKAIQAYEISKNDLPTGYLTASEAAELKKRGEEPFALAQAEKQRKAEEEAQAQGGVNAVKKTETAGSDIVENAARQASFDCAKAGAPVELLICGDDEMAALDREMANLYKSYRSTLSNDGRKDLLQQQRAWLKDRLAQCGIPASGEISGSKKVEARDCLAELFRQRSVALGGNPPPQAAPEPDNEAAQRPVESGKETAENQELANLREAAVQGNADAQYDLGVMLRKGRGIAQNYFEALKWYRMAGEQGHAIAQYELGSMYQNGLGVEPDLAEALKWYRMAAEQEHAAAQYNLGSMYQNGLGVAPDNAEALKWYRMAAEQGDGELKLAANERLAQLEEMQKKAAAIQQWISENGKRYSALLDGDEGDVVVVGKNLKINLDGDAVLDWTSARFCVSRSVDPEVALDLMNGSGKGVSEQQVAKDGNCSARISVRKEILDEINGISDVDRFSKTVKSTSVVLTFTVADIAESSTRIADQRAAAIAAAEEKATREEAERARLKKEQEEAYAAIVKNVEDGQPGYGLIEVNGGSPDGPQGGLLCLVPSDGPVADALEEFILGPEHEEAESPRRVGNSGLEDSFQKLKDEKCNYFSADGPDLARVYDALKRDGFDTVIKPVWGEPAEIDGLASDIQGRIRLCDTLAADAYDKEKVGDGGDLVADELDRAFAACGGAAERYIYINRYLYQFARVLAKREQHDLAISLLAPLADAGYAAAQSQLGKQYYRGNSVAKDHVRAAALFAAAAEQGYIPAMHNIGYLTSSGEGVAKEPEAAVAWYAKAAELGYPRSQHNLANALQHGLGTQKDVSRAISWYRKAAEGGYVGSLVQLGLMYDYGEDVPQDYAEAARWFELAAEQGDSDAQYFLAEALEKGRGVEADLKKAIHWYTKAGEAGNQDAQLFLARTYEHGAGVPQDSEKAIHWYTKTAEAGDSESQYRLGLFYAAGELAPRNFETSIGWLNAAVKGGHAKAQDALQQVTQQKAEEERAAGRRAEEEHKRKLGREVVKTMNFCVGILLEVADVMETDVDKLPYLQAASLFTQYAEKQKEYVGATTSDFAEWRKLGIQFTERLVRRGDSATAKKAMETCDSFYGVVKEKGLANVTRSDIPDFPAPAEVARSPSRNDQATAMCQSHIPVVEQALYLRRNGVPISSAMDIADSAYTLDRNLYAVLRGSIKEAYNDPSYVKEILKDGRWLEVCAEKVRGY